MEDKQLLSSETIQGIIGLVGTVAYLLSGVEVLPEEQKALGVAVVAIIALGSAVRAYLGRLKANRNLKIGSKKL